MDESAKRTPRRAVRLLLLAAGAGLLWAGVSLFASSGTANAAENDDGQGGLVGVVSGVISGASGLVQPAADAVAEVAPPVAPVTDTVTGVTGDVTHETLHVVDSVPEIVPEVAPVVEPIAQEVVEPIAQPIVDQVARPVVEQVAQPTIDAVAPVTDAIPIVGGVVDALDLTGTVAAVPGLLPELAQTLDDVVDTTLTGTELPVLPLLPPVPSAPASPSVPGYTPLPDAPPPALSGAGPVVSSTSPTVSTAIPPAIPATRDAASWPRAGSSDASVLVGASSAHGSSPDGGPFGSPWPANTAPAPTSGIGSVGAGSATALAAAEPLLGHILSSSAVPAADDRLPALPVFEADTSPD